MSNAIYLFDTNIISNLRPGRNPQLLRRILKNQHQTLCLCEPVIFEVERGLEHRQAYKQLQHFQNELIPLFSVVSVTIADWRVAAKLWADARRRGRQLSDIDVLLASMTLRLDGVLVTDDQDFKHLPLIQTVNWLSDSSD